MPFEFYALDSIFLCNIIVFIAKKCIAFSDYDQDQYSQVTLARPHTHPSRSREITSNGLGTCLGCSFASPTCSFPLSSAIVLFRNLERVENLPRIPCSHALSSFPAGIILHVFTLETVRIFMHIVEHYGIRRLMLRNVHGPIVYLSFFFSLCCVFKRFGPELMWSWRVRNANFYALAFYNT